MGVRRVTEQNIKTIIEKLELVPLEGEGGMYRRTYAGDPDAEGRHAYSVIYYLLTQRTFSHMHKLNADEVYHFYMGDGMELLILYPDGRAECRVLGCNLDRGEIPQFRVPAGCWQGSRVVRGGTYSLVGTTMTPAYEEEMYTHGVCEELCKKYPLVSDKIRERCGAVAREVQENETII